MIPPYVKLGLVIYIVFLVTEIAYGDETNLGKSFSMDTMIRDTCSRSLSRLIYQICTGNVPISDLPPDRLSTVRGKRAAILFKERLKRQVADECCQNSCSISQLVQYCPDTW